MKLNDSQLWIFKTPVCGEEMNCFNVVSEDLETLIFKIKLQQNLISSLESQLKDAKNTTNDLHSLERNVMLLKDENKSLKEKIIVLESKKSERKNNKWFQFTFFRKLKFWKKTNKNK